MIVNQFYVTSPFGVFLKLIVDIQEWFKEHGLWVVRRREEYEKAKREEEELVLLGIIVSEL